MNFTGNISEMIVFAIYLVFMLGIGVYFFIKQRKHSNEKEYFLGGRNMGPWVTALSAGASDMSAWVLMGLPTSIFALGLGQVWIPVGLALGYTLSWIFEAKRLRSFSVVCKDSITVPQYLTNRFKSQSKSLQVICAIVFLLAYTVYTASSVKACGTLFNTVFGIDDKVAMFVAAFILVGYTFLGGFKAVCWTDFFQGLLIIGAMFLAPIFAATTLDFSQAASSFPAGFMNPFTSWQDIASGLAWGLGYFGMPHIIVRFMSLRSQKDVKKSAAIGISWTALVVLFAALIGIIGKVYLVDADTESIVANSTVFIEMVRKIFEALPIVAGLLLAAVLAASMSTADSQLLAASSAFSSDFYKPVIRKGKASDNEMNWVGRIVVLVIAFIAVAIALLDKSATIMSLVSNAWGVFGAAFGPAIMLSLFWKKFNFAGAVAGIVGGAAADIIWLALFTSTGAGWGTCIYDTGLYELLPGFVIGLIAAIVATKLTGGASKEVKELFDQAVNYEE